MFSATWPKEVRTLAKKFSENYIQVNIGNEELTVNKKITQQVEIVKKQDKFAKLLFFLQEHKNTKIIIFSNMKSTCDFLEMKLKDKRFNTSALHGNKSQTARDFIIENFRNNRSNILIATDVAARGLDIKDVKIVINYDLPTNIEDYVHRVGRTARGSTLEGKSVTYFCPETDFGNARKFLELLRKGESEIPKELEELASRNFKGRNTSRGYGNRNSYRRYSNY